MEKNVINVSKSFLKAKVESGKCPLDWLAEFYKEYPGKLVMLDKNLMNFLVNKAHNDSITIKDQSDYVQNVTVLWNATADYPETRVVVASCGRSKIDQDKNGKYIIDDTSNYYIIEQLNADDILVNDMKYADNIQDDEQIIFLVGEDLEDTDNLSK